MKRFLKYIIIAIILVLSCMFALKVFNKNYDIQLEDGNIKYDLKLKGVEGARDFVVDEDENIYLVFKDKIQLIKNNGHSNNIYKNKNWDITSVDFKDNKLYYASGNRVGYINLKDKKETTLIKDIPNFGDYSKSKIKINKSKIYITIGSATNSGVVGKDNKWLNKNIYSHDLSPKDLILKGKNFGKEHTGAFVPFKTQTRNYQVISAHFPGNSSILEYDLKNKKCITYSWGIRNIEGLDINTEGKIIATVGGMENRGSRPIIGDSDYIYEIKKNTWYGWPDFSGGDPVTSPKFKGKNKTNVQFILDKHPSFTTPAPIYQYNKEAGTIGNMAIDKEGIIGARDNIYFYDKKDNSIYGLTKSGTLNKKVRLNKNSFVQSIKFYKDKMFILDNKAGVLYSISSN